MSLADPFPEDILDEVREYPGNDKCCDCPSIDTDWASVSHGTLICLECAGKHRSLGVHVSFVRSITMDTWSRQQVEMMRQGGNGQIRRFFKKLEIDNSPIHLLYCTKGAEHYREKLKERVEKIMSGEIKSEKRLVKKKSFAEEKILSSSATFVDIPTFDVPFGEGPLGLTLTKDFKERACVSKLVPAGPAQLAGVLVGDFVVGVAGKKLTNFDEIMHMIPCMGRPLVLQFARISSAKSKVHHPITSIETGNIHPSRSEPNLKLSLSRSPDGIQRKQHSALLTEPTSVPLANSSESKDLKKDSTSRASPRVAIRVHRKMTDDSEDVSGDDGHLPTTGSRHIKRVSGKGSQEQLPRLELPPDIEVSTLNDLESKSTTIDSKHAIALDSRLTQSEKTFTTRHSWDHRHSVVASTSNTIVDIVNNSEALSDDTLRIEEELSVRDEEDDEHDNSISATDDDYDDDDDDGGSGEGEDDFDDKEQEDIEVAVEDHGVERGFSIHSNHDKVDNSCVVNETSDSAGYENFVEEDSITSDFRFAAGSIVKVLRESDGRWKSAVIHRVHKDGTFKVIYSNGTKESHVGISRIATDAVVLGPASVGSMSAPNVDSHQSKHTTTKSPIHFENYEHCENPDLEFKVDANEDLDAWIEKDFASELQSIDVLYEDSYFLKKTVRGTAQTSSFAKTEVETATYKEFSVKFEQSPLGLTLSTNKSKEPVVIRIKSEGNAQAAGIAIGDVLLQIDQYPVSEYDEAMQILPGCIYPLMLKFRRGNRNLVMESGEAIVKGSMFVANKLIDRIGLNSKTSILDQPTVVRAMNSSQSISAVGAKNSGPKLRHLPALPSDGEFDIIFEQGELGFRLEEKPGSIIVSVVTEVLEKGQASSKGLRIGCILVGINRDPYLSHAHAVATLKHIKRPVTVRFKHRICS